MKDYRVYLVHIVEAINKIERYTSSGEVSFFDDEMAQDAVTRNLEIVGEAAKRIPQDIREANTGIPWRTMAELRDVLIHDYEGVNLIRVWDVVKRDLPLIRIAIMEILPPLDVLEEKISCDDNA